MKKFLIYLSIVCIVVNMIFAITSVWAEDEILEPASSSLPELYIRAVNPGYTIDKVNNVGEMIEISRNNSDNTPYSLAGATVGYTNSSGKQYPLYEFPENSWMTGETLLLRLASSPESGLANAVYTKTLAFQGELSLSINGEVIDQVCWTGKNDCYKEFKSDSPTTLVRNLETGEFEHLFNYQPDYSPDNYYLEENPKPDEPAPEIEQCLGIKFSEILTNYDIYQTDQFIELYNSTLEEIDLDGCFLRYKNKNYQLTGAIKAKGYFVYRPTEFTLTKNPTSSNTLELIDVNNQVVDQLIYPKGQKAETSYALVGQDKTGKDLWKNTYAPTPGSPNIYQEFRKCEAGKVINKTTGNCIKQVIKAPKVCQKGYVLNPETNRCRKIKQATAKVCKAGYYLNPETNRCRKFKKTTKKTCKKGYELNPETNRCRKIKNNKGANYGLEPEDYAESSSFIALYAVLGVVGIGLIYLIFEFRHEIAKIFGKVFRRSR